MVDLQLQAGAVLDDVRVFISNCEVAGTDEVQSMLNSLCYFDLSVSGVRKPDNSPNALYQVAENLISRGLPTRPSLCIEDTLFEHMQESGIAVRFPAKANMPHPLDYKIEASHEFAELLWRALHIIDPKASISRPSVRPGSTAPTYGSKEERIFFEQGLPSCLPSCFQQIIESERDLQSILNLGNQNNAGERPTRTRDFINQRVDFSIEFPYAKNGIRGIVFEIDGSQHRKRRETRHDAKRDASLKDMGFRTIRIPSNMADNPSEYLQEAIDLANGGSDYLRTIIENCTTPILENPLGKIAQEVALLPFACSRIEKVILHLINTGQLDLHADSWRILCIEHDIACAELALEELQGTISALAALAGTADMPGIDLVATTPNKLREEGVPNIEERFDLLIDHSILGRSFENAVDDNIDARVRCAIRSAKSISSTRVLHSNANITYLPLGALSEQDGEELFVEDEDQVRHLEKMLQDIFRKSAFRPGQVQTLDYTLSNRNVVGLLPTGSGKSLVYQLSALLQPGVCIVVDPLKSLMRDQRRGLLSNGIDGAVYINSSLSTLQRERAIKTIASGRSMFAFISPERFQIESFRQEMLRASHRDCVSFSYCVIDEAHCVSEWGHEFRTPYLCVGVNARRFCKSWGRDEIPLIALTATASYDVLADIQRELGIDGGDSVVTLSSEQMRRGELSYHVIDIDPGLDTRNENIGMWDIRRAIGDQKAGRLVRELEDKNPAESPTLVFCPHRNGSLGVRYAETYFSDSHIEDDWDADIYMGNDGETQQKQKEREEANQNAQDSFISGNVNLLFATKAFGMGIDKPDIRNVYHINMPSSIEGYYQEAGRAGRDGKDSDCTIIYCSQKFPALNDNTLDSDILRSFHDNNFRGQDFEKAQLYELLTQIRFPKINYMVSSSEIAISQYHDIKNCGIWESEDGGKRRLYVNDGWGYFNLTSSEFLYSPGKNSLSSDAVKAVQDILENAPVLEPEDENRIEPGIETLLEEREVGDRFIVSVPFSNDIAAQIANDISSKLKIPFTMANVLKAASYCSNGSEFVRKLEQGSKADGGFPKKFKRAFEKQLIKIRTQESTMKAIYRLFSIGVIYDYTIDYVKQEITCYIEKRDETGYRECLRRYLAKYFAVERVDEELDSLDDRPGNTFIQKCLNLLIDFTYSEIAAQRRSSIAAMEEACRYGLENPEGDRFEEYIMMYMSSRYARRQYLPKDTDNGNLESYDIVKKYINLVRTDKGGEINSLKHLRGAALLLHAQRPDNYVFLLLKSFASFILDKNRKQFVDQATEEALQGFNRIMSLESLQLDDVCALIDSFADKIATFDNEAAEPARNIKMPLIHRHHLEWLKNYGKSKPYVIAQA